MKTKTKEHVSQSPEDTIQFGKEFARDLSSGDVVALDGDLGAGKTVLTKGMCLGLGFSGEVTSPSFVRVHCYPHDPPLYHADFYLLRSEEEVFQLGLDEVYGEDSIVIVEWAQRFPDMLPSSCWWIKIEWPGGEENIRRLRITKT